jgi:hypothetical protein
MPEFCFQAFIGSIIIVHITPRRAPWQWTALPRKSRQNDFAIGLSDWMIEIWLNLPPRYLHDTHLPFSSPCVPVSDSLLDMCFLPEGCLWMQRTMEIGARHVCRDLCSLQSICIPVSVETIGNCCFSRCNMLRSFRFDSPSKLRFLFSIPSPSCSSIDIPDSVEVFQSAVGINSDAHLILSLGCKSQLRVLKLSGLPKQSNPSSVIQFRAFIRLFESTLRLFRSNLSSIWYADRNVIRYHDPSRHKSFRIRSKSGVCLKAAIRECWCSTPVPLNIPDRIMDVVDARTESVAIITRRNIVYDILSKTETHFRIVVFRDSTSFISPNLQMFWARQPDRKQ